MCQLIVKDFELCFGRSGDDVEQNLRRAHESWNPEETLQVVPEQDQNVRPFARNAHSKVILMQAYFLPLTQLRELISHLTGVNSEDLLLPKKFSFKKPVKLQTPNDTFYNTLFKLSQFESLDVLCLTRESAQTETEGVVPPKDLIRILFETYSKVFQANQTQHTLLYYLY